MRISFGFGLAGLLAAATVTPAAAQSYFSQPTGYQAGNVMVHVSLIGVVPEDLNSAVRVGAANQNTPSRRSSADTRHRR